MRTFLKVKGKGIRKCVLAIHIPGILSIEGSMFMSKLLSISEILQRSTMGINLDNIKKVLSTRATWETTTVIQVRGGYS